MTYDEALYVLAHREEYNYWTFLYALEIVEQQSESWVIDLASVTKD